MPEAELPGNQHLPEKKDPVNREQLGQNQSVDRKTAPLAPETHTQTPEAEDEWETVNFPNAISVDSIPVVETADAEAKNLLPTTQTQPQENSQETQLQVVPSLGSQPHPTRQLESTNIMAALHECNRELISRVTELETALEECQENLENQEKLLEARTQELASTQQQVTRLFYKLELCNQIIQRQEVLVESLTNKWEQSQQQQAQMERECSLTQQLYNQQSYHLKELENSCKELRSRLYRQQRQTLQFKAALERCLEMPGRMDAVNQPLLETSVEQSPVTEVTLTSEYQPPTPPTDENLSSNPSIDIQPLPLVTSQPVKPWSPQPKRQQQAETITNKSEKTIAKMSFGKKVDLPQGLEAPQPPVSSNQNQTSEELYGDISKNQLNPSLPSFTRIAQVPSYELAEESPQVILEDVEAAEYVITETDLVRDQNPPEQVEITEEHLIEASLEKDTPEYDEAEANIKTERISWNIATGKWNVSEYQLEADTEIDPEDFLEDPEIMQQYPEQTAQVSSKLQLPTWNPPVVEPVIEVPQQQHHSSQVAIDLPTFPKIPIDDRSSAVGG